MQGLQNFTLIFNLGVIGRPLFRRQFVVDKFCGVGGYFEGFVIPSEPYLHTPSLAHPKP